MALLKRGVVGLVRTWKTCLPMNLMLFDYNLLNLRGPWLNLEGSFMTDLLGSERANRFDVSNPVAVTKERYTALRALIYSIIKNSGVPDRSSKRLFIIAHAMAIGSQ
jgi:hypothetical protein